jgi:hypothetical protein
MIDFWRFVPAVKRPWNPAYRDVWNTMTHRERQVSFLIDICIIVGAFLAFVAGKELGKVLFP